jgi:hypothetical protein
MDRLVAKDHQGNNNGRDQSQTYEDPIICTFNGDGAWNHLLTSFRLAADSVPHLSDVQRQHYNAL